MFKFKSSLSNQQSLTTQSRQAKTFQELLNVQKSTNLHDQAKLNKIKTPATRQSSMDRVKLAKNAHYKLSLNNEKQNNVSTKANNNLESKLGELKNELNKLKGNLNHINNEKALILCGKELIKTRTTSKKSKANNLNIRKSLTSSQRSLKPLQAKAPSIKSLNLIGGKRTASLNSNFPREKSEDVLRVERELKKSHEKCQALESLVEEKNKRIENYSNTLREISENINCLINNLENLDFVKESSDQQKSNLTKEDFDLKLDTNSVNNLKECLHRFKHKMSAYSFGANQEKNLPKPIESNPTNKEPAQQRITKITEINLKDAVRDESFLPITTNMSGVVTSTTSSDTLIDADFSFQSIHLLPYKPLNPKAASKESHKKEGGFFSTNIINLDYGQGDDEDGEENERININLDELSITTIETLNSSSSLALSSATNSTMSTYNNLEDNMTFENGLQELDQKIDKVKQLIESMRSN